MTRLKRTEMLEMIRANIERSGHHVYLVTGGSPTPRFLYTIGVSPVAGVELFFAGAAIYRNGEVKRIISSLAYEEASQLVDGSTIEVDSLGSFTLRKVDSSWSVDFVLGALDYYQKLAIPVLQIVPDDEHWTIDIPDFSQPRSEGIGGVWKWLTEPWPYAVSDRSVAVTDLDVLRGQRVTAAVRWEDGEWEAYSRYGPDIPKDEIRKVPLGTLLGADPTLSVVTKLKVGDGIWRDLSDMEWHDWEE